MSEQGVLDFLRRHLKAIFGGDWDGYAATTGADLTLYEHFVTPHRQEGLDFHRFMIQNGWATREREHFVSILEPKVQFLGGEQVAVVSYTLLLSVATDSGITHRSSNETRVLEKRGGEWKVVHVHKSPAS